MITCIVLGEEEILGIVARHLAKHNNTAIHSARWAGPLREIIAPLLTQAQRKPAPAILPAKAERRPKSKLQQKKRS